MPLSKKTYQLITLALIILVSVVSYQLNSHIQADMRSELASSLNTVLDTTHQAIYSWQREHRIATEIWANTEVVRQATQKLLNIKPDAESLLSTDVQRTLHKWLQPVHVGKGYHGYFIISKDNISLASSREHNVGVKNPLAKQKQFLEKIWAGKTALSTPLKSEVSLPDKTGKLRIRLPTMFVGAPIRNSVGKVIAVFTFRINPAEDFTTILQKGRIGNSGETYAFDHQGRLISNSRFDNQLRSIGLITPLQRAILNLELRDPGVNLLEGETITTAYELLPFTRMAASAIQGESGTDLDGYRDYRGVPVVGAWRWDKNLGFGMATEQNRDEAYQIFNTTRNIIVTFTVLIILLLVGIMFALYERSDRKKAITELKKVRADLEDKVAERTKTLVRTNEELIAEVNDRKRIEYELREEKDFAESLIETAQAIVMVLDPDARIVRFNRYMEELSGYTFSEVKGKDWFNTFLPEQEQKNIHELFKKAISGHRTQGNINPIVLKNGSQRFIEWYDRSLRDQEGNTIGLLTIGHDVTKRILAEEALRESEERYRNLIELSPDAVVVHDVQGKILFVNSAAVKMAGATSTVQLLGKSIYDFVHPDYHDEATGMISQMLNDKHSVGPVEQKLLTLDGSVIYAGVTASYLQFENMPAIQALIRNITSRIQAERVLREERDKAQRYLDTVEAIIVALDREGRITLINRKGCELLGKSEQELLGKNWFETCLPQPEGKEIVEPVFHQIIDGALQEAEYYENPILNYKGEQRLIAWHNTYLHDGDGNIIGTLSSGDDITDRKQTEKQTLELLQQNRELTQQLFRLQEEERQNIARELHDEFGQWLTAIQFDAQNITNLIGKQSPKVDTSVESIIHSADRIHDGIRNMIHTLRPALLDELGLTDSLRELINQWQEYNPDIDCQLLLQGDLNKLGKNLSITVYRLVQEALTNVTKHAQANKVVVQLERKPASGVDKDNLHLHIEDNGIGIDSDVLSAGLGLPGMRERVLSSGGTFSIDGACHYGEPKGTCIDAMFVIDTK